MTKIICFDFNCCLFFAFEIMANIHINAVSLMSHDARKPVVGVSDQLTRSDKNQPVHVVTEES